MFSGKSIDMVLTICDHMILIIISIKPVGIATFIRVAYAAQIEL